MINLQSMEKVYRCRLAGGTNHFEPMDLGHLDRKVPESTTRAGNVDRLAAVPLDVPGEDHALVCCQKGYPKVLASVAGTRPRGTILSGWPLTTTYSA